MSIPEAVVSVSSPSHKELGVDLAFENSRVGTYSKLSDHEDFGFGPGSSGVVDLASRMTNASDEAIAFESEVR